MSQLQVDTPDGAREHLIVLNPNFRLVKWSRSLYIIETYCWLVVSCGFKHFWNCPFHIWDVLIFPTDFHSIIFQRGRWLNHQPVPRRFPQPFLVKSHGLVKSHRFPPWDSHGNIRGNLKLDWKYPG